MITPLELETEEANQLFGNAETENLMLRKNHDYGEAWRDMRVNSLTDLILMKLLMKQIEIMMERLLFLRSRCKLYGYG